MQAILNVLLRQDVFFLFGMRKVVSKTTYTTNGSAHFCEEPSLAGPAKSPKQVVQCNTNLNLQRCAPRGAIPVGVPPGAAMAA